MNRQNHGPKSVPLAVAEIHQPIDKKDRPELTPEQRRFFRVLLLTGGLLVAAYTGRQATDPGARNMNTGPVGTNVAPNSEPVDTTEVPAPEFHTVKVGEVAETIAKHLVNDEGEPVDPHSETFEGYVDYIQDQRVDGYLQASQSVELPAGTHYVEPEGE